MEDIEQILLDAAEAMDKAYAYIRASLAKIRAGRALPDMVEGILLYYHGSTVPISQMASVSTPDARTLSIKPWESSCLGDIEAAITHSQLGLTPHNDGETIRIHVPPLTEERRKVFSKQAKTEAEKSRVTVRNIRKEGKELLNKLKKQGISTDSIRQAEAQLQTLTDRNIQQVDQLLADKEAEIMVV
ncbi:MAG: ribosome recycling factor [Bacteroidota bacterium]